MPISESDKYDLLDRLAEEFAARYRHGERPALKEYLDRYPDLADDIRRLLPAMVVMEDVKEDARAPTDADARAPALSEVGDYRILREVGRGGMGVVYEAEQVSLGRRVALKLLPRQRLRDAAHRHRFEREARAAAKLHHTNIVPVFGVGEHEGQPYYVMQFIRGLGLDEVIDELNKLHTGAGAGGTAPGGPRSARRDLSAAEVARSMLTGALPLVPAEEADVPADATNATVDLVAAPAGCVLSRELLPSRESRLGRSLALPC
jgi:hypothetical protein